MPKQRDYQAEYARRVARERERASREGRPFSRAAARGHTRDAERREELNQRRRIERLRRRTKTERSAVRFNRANDVPESETEQMLRDKLEAQTRYAKGDKGYGKSRWSNRIQWMPASYFYYQGKW